MKSFNLSRKFTVGFLLLGAVICATSCTIGYVKYKSVIEKMYNDTAYQIAHVAESYVDGDTVERYLQTMQKDEAYEESLFLLTDLREKMGVNYIYVARLSGLDLTYVMDAENPNDDLPAFALGDTGKINPDFLEDSMRIVEKGEKVDNYFYSHSQFGYNTSAIIPVYNSQNKIVGIIGVEIAMTKLEGTLFEYVLYAVIFSSLLTAAFIFCYLAYLRKHVIRPIQLVTHEASAFSQNETAISEKLDSIQTRDEIQDLAAALKKMELDIDGYIKNIMAITAEKERIGAELSVATHIQASMLPCIFPAFPGRPEFDIFATMEPAKEVGGDFYDFFLIDDDHLAVVIADVSGKGIPAALFMVIAKTLIKDHAQLGTTPAEVFTQVNEKLCESNEEGLFVTAWMGVLQISSGRMTFVNAGHNPPLIRHKDGTFEYLKQRPGFVLAGMEGTRYRSGELTLSPGETLYLYTDGVTEATDASNALYGEERLKKILDRCGTESPHGLLPLVKADIDAFVGEAPQFDDITMLALQMHI